MSLPREVVEQTMKVLAECGGNQCEAARRLNITRNAVQARMRRAALEPALVAAKPDLQKHVKELEAEIRRRDEAVKELEAEIRRRDEEAREDELRRSMKFTPLVIPVEKHLPGAPGMPMTLWSDWHWGEEVDIRETGGLNEFNKEIAERRVNNLVNRTISLLRDYSGRRPEFPGMWVFLGGDMVSGLIHDELIETNWGNIVAQSMGVAGAISGALGRLADEFCGPVEAWHPGLPQIGVVGVVGNHGRTTRKPRAKGKATDSYDRAVYHSVAAHFAGDPRFSFVIPDDTDYLVEVYGHRFLLTHGDSLGTKGGNGIIGPIGPIMRGSIKIRNSEAVVGRDFDTLVVAHWHCDQPRGTLFPVIVNGTLKGFDEYALVILRAKFARPPNNCGWSRPSTALRPSGPSTSTSNRGTRDAVPNPTRCVVPVRHRSNADRGVALKHGVYLAGPITGLSYKGATDWRDVAEEELKSAGIRPISPLRRKKYLAHIDNLPAVDAELGKMVPDLSALSSDKGVTTRDRFDATNCDVLLVNLLGATKVSIGTVMEIAWADLRRTPIVCAIEPSGNVHEHMMVMDAIGFRVPSLEEAIRITKAILL